MIHLRGLMIALFLWNAILPMFVCSARAASGEGSQPSWQLFKSETGRFSVEMPATPVETTTHKKSFIGNITSHLFLSKNGNGEYAVAYSDLPGFAVKFASSNTVYSHAKGALLLETLGKEQQYGNTTLNGMRGKHLVYDIPDPQTGMDMRGESYLFLISNRLYVIDANLPIGHMRTDAQRFFSSFQIRRK